MRVTYIEIGSNKFEQHLSWCLCLGKTHCCFQDFQAGVTSVTWCWIVSCLCSMEKPLEKQSDLCVRHLRRGGAYVKFGDVAGSG